MVYIFPALNSCCPSIERNAKLSVHPIYAWIQRTLYYIQTERCVTMQNRQVINVKVANAVGIVLSITFWNATRDISISPPLVLPPPQMEGGRGRCKFHRRSCVNWRELNRWVIVVYQRIRAVALSPSRSFLIFLSLSRISRAAQQSGVRVSFALPAHTLLLISSELFARRGFTIHTCRRTRTMVPPAGRIAG